jgi:hypothetical protein
MNRRMKKLIEFLGILLLVSLLIACPLLCGLSIVYRWGEGVIGVFSLVYVLVCEFMFLWDVIEDRIKGKKE